LKEVLKQLKDIETQYSKSELSELNNEDLFMHAYVELLKQTISMLYLIIGDRYSDDKNGLPIKITKDEAIIGGNITRLIKLNTSFLENVCNGKLEICYILSRCIAETAINIQYMLSEGEESVLRNYIKYSLITEKELWNTIKENIKDRGGEKQDIEKRMENSILSSFDESDFKLEDVNRSSKWKSIAKRAAYVAGDMFYGVYYGISSHSVHGNWQEILLNNLEKEDDGFKLNLQWNMPRPQVLDVAIGLNLKVVYDFIEKESVTEKDLFLEKTKLLMKYHNDLLYAHEKFVQA
jgi:hypothetical protein